MKKFLSIFFVSIIMLTLVLSASDTVQTKVKSLAGDKMYSSAIVPLPDQPDNQLASKDAE